MALPIVRVAWAFDVPKESMNDDQMQSTPDGASSAQGVAQPVQQPSQAQQPVEAPAQATVQNEQPTPPAVQHASWIHQIAQTLAGGPRYTTAVDTDTGEVKRTAAPLSNSDIGMAIAMAAISGGLSGLSQPSGPNAEGRAAAAGFNTVKTQNDQLRKQQEDQARADAQSRSDAIVRAAQLHEINSRTLLNTSEAEAQGAEAIDKLTAINRASGVLDVDPSILASETPMTQQELLDAMQKGDVNTTSNLGSVAGRVEVTDRDGTKRWEATHLVVKDPRTPVTLTQEAWDRYAAAQVPGFPAGAKIGQGGVQVKLATLQRANEVLGAHTLANQRLSDLSNVLTGTEYAGKVPHAIDFGQPGVERALETFQKYVSHNAANLSDPFAALQQMGADRRDPHTGEMQPNPDAKFVDTVAGAFGGWPVLEAAHDQIKANSATAEKYAVIDTQDKAEAVLAAPKRFTPDQRSAAQRFVSLQQAQGIGKAVAEARAHAHATGADVEAMFRFGTNPVTGERLTMTNAPDSMLVTPTGTVVPQNLVTVYKPTAQQRQTADTARQVLAISNDLQQQITKNPALIGPLAGRDKQAMAKLGFGDAESQKLLDNVSLLQSAVTKMHTGRFSSEILKKTGALITPGMNQDQFNGAISSIQDVAGRYAQEDQLRTVADYKAQQKPAVQQVQQTPARPRSVQIPAGAQIGKDAHGNVVGYKLPNGQYVPLGAC